MTTTGKLIAIVGIDGAGKSTLTAALHAALKDTNTTAITVGKHTTEVPMSAELSEYLDNLNAVVYRRKTGVGHACGEHYWLFALAAWYSAQDRLIIKPALDSGTHVVLDNTHHKVLARYAASSEVPIGLARDVYAHLTRPDVVLFLQVSPQESLRRREGAFTQVEVGFSGSGDQTFITYQNAVAAELRKQAASDGSAWIAIDVDGKSPDTVLNEALAALSPHLGISPA